MTFKQFILFITIATLGVWLGWFWTVFSIDPYTTNFIGFFLFYTTLFLSLFGTFTLFGVMLRKMRVPNAMVFHLVLLASRQAFFLAMLFIVLLIFQSQRWLDFWLLALILLIAFGVEGYNLYRHHKTIRFDQKPVAGDLPEMEYYEGVPPQFEKKEVPDV